MKYSFVDAKYTSEEEVGKIPVSWWSGLWAYHWYPQTMHSLFIDISTRWTQEQYMKKCWTLRTQSRKIRAGRFGFLFLVRLWPSDSFLVPKFCAKDCPFRLHHVAVADKYKKYETPCARLVFGFLKFAVSSFCVLGHTFFCYLALLTKVFLEGTQILCLSWAVSAYRPSSISCGIFTLSILVRDVFSLLWCYCKAYHHALMRARSYIRVQRQDSGLLRLSA